MADTTTSIRPPADFHGKWLVLCPNPFEFTPVRTADFIGFAEAVPQLKAMICEPLGLSIDSIYSHIAWTRNIADTSGVEILPSFPGWVIEGTTPRCVSWLPKSEAPPWIDRNGMLKGCEWIAQPRHRDAA